jgi:hypothetical protein
VSQEERRRPAPGQAASLGARRERAAGRIVDDERLRGPLADETFAPLQEWALGWVDAYARATAGLDDAAAEAALEAGLGWARAQLGALVGLLADWPSLSETARADRLARLAPTFPSPRLARAAGALASIADPSEAAARVAAALPRAPS